MNVQNFNQLVMNPARGVSDFTGGPDMVPDLGGFVWPDGSASAGAGSSGSTGSGSWQNWATALGGLFGSGSGSASSGGASSSGGGSSSAGGVMAGAMSGAATGAVAGPWGAAAGGVIGALSSILGNIGMEGWSISCIGNQAFNNNDFQREMNLLEQKKNAVNGSDLGQVQQFINFASYQSGWGKKAMDNFRSSCSKTLMGKYVEASMAAVNTVKSAYQHTATMVTHNHEIEGPFTYPNFKIIALVGSTVGGNTTGQTSGGSSSQVVFVPGVGFVPTGTGGENTPGTVVPPQNPGTPSGGDVILPDNFTGGSSGLSGLSYSEQAALNEFSASNGLPIDQVLNAFFAGQLQIKDGKIIWSVNAGNRENSGIMDLVLWGGAAFVLFKFLKK